MLSWRLDAFSPITRQEEYRHRISAATAPLSGGCARKDTGPMRRIALRGALATALLVSTALSAASIRPATARAAGSGSGGSGGGGVTSLGFPRVGNYAGYDYPALAPIYTRYGFLIAKESFTWDGSNAIQTLRAANPTATIVTRERTALMDYTKQTYYGR